MPCSAAEEIVASMTSAALEPVFDNLVVSLGGVEVAIGSARVWIGQKAIDALKFVFQMRPDKCFPKRRGVFGQILAFLFRSGSARTDPARTG